MELNPAALLQDAVGNGQAIAVADSILVIAYHLIARQEVYQDLVPNYFDQQRPEATTKRLVRRLEHLGYEVSLQPQPSASVA